MTIISSTLYTNVFISNHNKPTTKLQSGTCSTEKEYCYNSLQKTTFSFLVMSFLTNPPLWTTCCMLRFDTKAPVWVNVCSRWSYIFNSIVRASHPVENTRLPGQKKRCPIAFAAHDAPQLVSRG